MILIEDLTDVTLAIEMKKVKKMKKMKKMKKNFVLAIYAVFRRFFETGNANQVKVNKHCVITERQARCDISLRRDCWSF